jgi:hypothetical protein
LRISVSAKLALLSLERRSLDEKQGPVCYRYGKQAKEMERMDYPDFILKLTFVADRPPPPHLAYQELLMAAEASTEYFPQPFLTRQEKSG